MYIYENPHSNERFCFSYYSNNDLRHITVFASPSLSRRHRNVIIIIIIVYFYYRRNVYKQPDKFWLLAQVEGREDQEAINKIDQLQKQAINTLLITKSLSDPAQVNVFQPLTKRTESLLTAQTREK